MKKLLKAPEGSAQQGFHLVSFGQDENLVIVRRRFFEVFQSISGAFSVQLVFICQTFSQILALYFAKFDSITQIWSWKEIIFTHFCESDSQFQKLKLKFYFLMSVSESNFQKIFTENSAQCFQSEFRDSASSFYS